MGFKVLKFKKGRSFTVLDTILNGWLLVQPTGGGSIGVVPETYVMQIQYKSEVLEFKTIANAIRSTRRQNQGQLHLLPGPGRVR